jgi:hypothetical protein
LPVSADTDDFTWPLHILANTDAALTVVEPDARRSCADRLTIRRRPADAVVKGAPPRRLEVRPSGAVSATEDAAA